MSQALQDRYAPNNECFGCGPKNPRGLRLKSHAENAAVVAEWTPEPHHKAFDGVLNGGIVGALLDCHSNWTAAWALMRERGAETPPCTVTAEFHVKLRAPTPLDRPLELRAKPAQIEGDRVVVEAQMTSGGKVTATCRGVFVAVSEGHPAYHRW
jgi:acyl-coenzyme A thioesterase PaaI-like protein